LGCVLGHSYETKSPVTVDFNSIIVKNTISYKFTNKSESVIVEM